MPTLRFGISFDKTDFPGRRTGVRSSLAGIGTTYATSSHARTSAKAMLAAVMLVV